MPGGEGWPQPSEKHLGFECSCLTWENSQPGATTSINTGTSSGPSSSRSASPSGVKACGGLPAHPLRSSAAGQHAGRWHGLFTLLSTPGLSPPSATAGDLLPAAAGACSAIRVSLTSSSRTAWPRQYCSFSFSSFFNRAGPTASALTHQTSPAISAFLLVQICSQICATAS